MRYIIMCAFLVLVGCAGTWHAPVDFACTPVDSGEYEIATWQRMLDPSAPIHIYIEGDGHAFDSRGVPTNNPTPRGTFLRDLVVMDTAPNVVYMARPCQYIMSDGCNISDWTDGRFSESVIESVATAIRTIAGNRPVILVGYSGGAMVSGLVILRHPEINVRQWITIAGVLNHTDWTNYFGDSPLIKSLDMTQLPDVPQLHYVGADDDIVPLELTQRMASDTDIIVIPNATHNDFKNLKLDFLD